MKTNRRAKRRLARYCKRCFKDHRYIDAFDTYDCCFSFIASRIIGKRLWFQGGRDWCREVYWGLNIGREVWSEEEVEV